MEEEMELRRYRQILRKRWKIVALLTLIAALTSGVISFYVLKPVYQASTTLIVGQKPTDSSQAAGQMMLNYDVLLANQQLAITYSTIAQSRSVEQKVLTDLSLSMTIEEFDKLIYIQSLKNTEILEIRASYTSPELAAGIANTMAEEFSKAVIDIKKVDSVSIVDKAVIPDKPVKPNKVLNILLAFAAGLMASIGLVLVLESMDNTIKTSLDVENLLEIPVLGIIPQG